MASEGYILGDFKSSEKDYMFYSIVITEKQLWS